MCDSKREVDAFDVFQRGRVMDGNCSAMESSTWIRQD